MDTGNKEWTSKQYDEAVVRKMDKCGPDPLAPINLFATCIIAAIDNPKVLDLGCGTGDFSLFSGLPFFETANTDYLGIDFSQKSIDIAKENHPQDKFICSDLLDPGLFKVFKEANTFVMIEVLEHLNDDIPLIRRIPAKGNVILSVPDYTEEGSGHVRCFQSLTEASERYGPYIELTWAAVHKFKSGNRIFILAGEKK